ncbi:unnamed protein product, partial [Closterium sp. NIES-53]
TNTPSSCPTATSPTVATAATPTAASTAATRAPTPSTSPTAATTSTTSPTTTPAATFTTAAATSTSLATFALAAAALCTSRSSPDVRSNRDVGSSSKGIGRGKGGGGAPLKEGRARSATNSTYSNCTSLSCEEMLLEEVNSEGAHAPPSEAGLPPLLQPTCLPCCLRRLAPAHPAACNARLLPVLLCAALPYTAHFPSARAPPYLRAALLVSSHPTLPAMASLSVLTFDHEGRLIQFNTWLDNLQLYLLSDSRDSVSLFDHTSGASLTPPATTDNATRSQWLTHDAAAHLAVRNHLPLAKPLTSDSTRVLKHCTTL